MGHFYDLSEFNVFKRSASVFTFKSIDGAEVEFDEKGAAIVLALQGSDVPGTLSLLRAAGFEASEAEVTEVLALFEELEIVSAEPRPIRRYDNAKALENVRGFAEGPLQLSEAVYTLLHHCPVDCGYCFRKDFEVRQVMKDEDFFRITDDLVQLGVLSLNISGGEPTTVWKRVAAIARDAFDKGIPNISVSTSGYQFAPEIAKAWSEAGIGCINLSLDNMDSGKHDAMYKFPGAWDMAHACLREFAKYPGVKMHVNVTYWGDNLDQVRPLAEFVREYDAFQVRVNPYVPTADLPPTHPRKVKEMWELVQRLRAEGFPIYTPIDPDEPLVDYQICPAGITRAVVEADGSVGGCQYLGSALADKANLKESRFLDVWRSGGWSDLRDNQKEIVPMCRDCEWRPYCVSNCFAMGLGLNDDPTSSKPFQCPHGLGTTEGEPLPATTGV